MPDELITMEKDGQVIQVHPLSLENHKELGWVFVEQPKAAQAQPEAPEPKKPAQKRK